MYGVMGYANAQRTLDYIRTITEFISQVSNTRSSKLDMLSFISRYSPSNRHS